MSKRSILENIKRAILLPNASLPQKSKQVLVELGDIPILSISICREPVYNEIEKALDTMSFGSFKKAKERLSYDRMFHLYAILNLKNGEKVCIEKNSKNRLL